MFCNFCLGKNNKYANNSATTEAREKNKHRFGIEFCESLNICLTKFRKNQIIVNKISHGFLGKWKLSTRWNVLIVSLESRQEREKNIFIKIQRLLRTGPEVTEIFTVVIYNYSK
jgi:hypothetical protein